MSSYPCPEGCPRVYSSIKTAMLCDCMKYDKYGYPQNRN